MKTLWLAVALAAVGAFGFYFEFYIGMPYPLMYYDNGAVCHRTDHGPVCVNFGGMRKGLP